MAHSVDEMMASELLHETNRKNFYCKLFSITHWTIENKYFQVKNDDGKLSFEDFMLLGGFYQFYQFYQFSMDKQTYLISKNDY